MDGESVIGLILLVMFGMLSIVLVLVIFINKAKNKVQSEQLERQLLINAHRKDMLESSVMGQEKERDRLSAELHDGIVSTLNIIHFKLTNIKLELSEEVKSEFTEIKDLLHASIGETRRISHDLFPVVLESFGIVTALEELKDLNRSNKIETVLHSDFIDADFKIDQTVHIYRVVQELVNNSIKYANCSKIEIHLLKSVEGFCLVYEDNGIGKKSWLTEGKGLGIKNLNSRLTILNANMEIIQLSPGLKFIITQHKKELE